MSDTIEIILTTDDTISVDLIEGESTLAENVGGEKEVYKSKTNSTLSFRTLKAGSNVTLTQNTNDIEISATDTGEANTVSNIGGENEIYKQKTGVDFELRTLKAGSNITIVQNTSDLEISASAGGSTSKIQDTAGTTSVDTEDGTYANQIIINSANTGTSYILQAFEGTGTPVPVFQIDGNGDILRNGTYIFSKASSGNAITLATNNVANNTNNGIMIGANAGGSFSTSGAVPVLIGTQSGRFSSGNFKIGIGYYAGYTTSGADQIFLGNESGHTGGSIANKIGIGKRAGAGTTGGILIGAYSGDFLTGSSEYVVIDPINRSNEAGELSDSLIIGIADATVTNQSLTFNAYTFLSTIKSGATQVGAGAAANEIWKTASHATLPDNVLMIGV